MSMSMIVTMSMPLEMCYSFYDDPHSCYILDYIDMNHVFLLRYHYDTYIILTLYIYICMYVSMYVCMYVHTIDLIKHDDDVIYIILLIYIYIYIYILEIFNVLLMENY